MARYWSETETAFLDEHRKDMRIADIAKHLGRSVSSVYGKLDLMGHKKSERSVPSPSAVYPHPRTCTVSDGFCTRSMCCYDCKNLRTCKNACKNNPRHCGCVKEWNE